MGTLALQALARGSPEISAVDELDGKACVRLIRPLLTEQSCLRCHASQGYQVGDVRGAISVSVPLKPLWSVARRHKTTLTVGHGLLWIVGLAGIVLASHQLLRHVRHLFRLESELRHSEAERTLLAEHNARLRAERSLAATQTKLALAAEIQRSLLPAKLPELSGIDVAAVLHPSDATSGDFYDFLRLPGGSWGILIADVSGHGIDSAMLMAVVTSHVRVLASFLSDPAQILTRLNSYHGG